MAYRIVNGKVQKDQKPPEAFWSSASSDWVITKSPQKRKQEKAEAWRTAIPQYKHVKHKLPKWEKDESKQRKNQSQKLLPLDKVSDPNLSSLMSMTNDQFKQYDGKTRNLSMHRDRFVKLGTDAIALNTAHLKKIQDEGPRAAAVL